ncbi:putative 2,4-dienoyl-CoA reductase [Planctomycetes bacterium CA13]|uniref:Putative 2,4-dienoyl-CoA reductase n=1 Tax=Novipirellula herctigrandis TaxID=2527986 RepID=A0A5C5ZBB9_9BACT|nr:putative 2,4-dienoyl-CoA reductase [Planctomycetes bacterium CA13]
MTLEINLDGKKALVTGVTSGIGAGIAAKLAEAGCDVTGCGRRAADDNGATAFLDSVHAHDRKAYYFSNDVSKPDEPQRLVDQAVDAMGDLDIVISNAGRNIFKGAENCSQADWDECMSLDLASHWRLGQAAKNHLTGNVRQPGVIVVITSNHAWNTIPGCFPYNVAKAGLVGLVQSLAIEWGPGIRSIGIAPGFIDTAGGDTWFNSFPDPSAERARTESMHPVGRIGSIEEIGHLCAFLASDLCGFINGTTLAVDGGRSALMQDD